MTRRVGHGKGNRTRFVGRRPALVSTARRPQTGNGDPTVRRDGADAGEGSDGDGAAAPRSGRPRVAVGQHGPRHNRWPARRRQQPAPHRRLGVGRRPLDHVQRLFDVVVVVVAGGVRVRRRKRRRRRAGCVRGPFQGRFRRHLGRNVERRRQQRGTAGGARAARHEQAHLCWCCCCWLFTRARSFFRRRRGVAKRPPGRRRRTTMDDDAAGAAAAPAPPSGPPRYAVAS